MNQLIEAQYVWHDDAGRGRNLHACFRLTFILDAAVVSARLNLFADTTYQLFVNGQFVEFGPIRFDPRFPMFDTVDIAHWLRVGRNVIAVSVNSFQHKTLKSITHQAGFITWGEVRTSDDATVSLATPGAWRGVPDLSLARYTGKFSFALNAAELFDQAGEEPGQSGSVGAARAAINPLPVQSVDSVRARDAGPSPGYR
jgi:alpha-L-rhamnosidase